LLLGVAVLRILKNNSPYIWSYKITSL